MVFVLRFASALFGGSPLLLWGRRLGGLIWPTARNRRRIQQQHLVIRILGEHVVILPPPYRFNNWGVVGVIDRLRVEFRKGVSPFWTPIAFPQLLIVSAARLTVLAGGRMYFVSSGCGAGRGFVAKSVITALWNMACLIR